MDPNRKFEPQKLKYFCNSLAIYAVDFPIYYAESISERHIIIAGGGGASKTGVQNQINIIELIPNGDSCAAQLISKYLTPEEIPDAIMAGAMMQDLPIADTRLIAAAGAGVIIYDIIFDSSKKTFAISNYSIARDPRVKAEIKSICYGFGRFFTGGIDGQLTIWRDGGKIHKQVGAHKKEIDEIEYDSVNQRLATLSRGEARLLVWDLAELNLIKEFKKDSINDASSNNNSIKLTFRSCRYVANNLSKQTSQRSFLLVACNPTSSKGTSKIYKYDSRDLNQISSQSVTNDGIMAMSVSQDGQHVAIGDRSGGVSVFQVKNLSNIYAIDRAHNNTVTRVEFLPSKPESYNLTNCQTCPLLSVSLDRRIVLHRPKKGSILTSLFKITLLILVIYLIFFALHYHFQTNNI